MFASSSPWPNALLVSPRLGRYALVDRGKRGLVIAEPVGHDGPVVITVHAMPPPSVPPWHPDHLAVHKAVKYGTYPQFAGVRKAAGCKSDAGVTVRTTMDARYTDATLGPRGVLHTYYGWLTWKRWGVDLSTSTTRSVFSRHQGYWQAG